MHGPTMANVPKQRLLLHHRRNYHEILREKRNCGLLSVPVLKRAMPAGHGEKDAFGLSKDVIAIVPDLKLGLTDLRYHGGRLKHHHLQLLVPPKLHIAHDRRRNAAATESVVIAKLCSSQSSRNSSFKSFTLLKRPFCIAAPPARVSSFAERDTNLLASASL